MGILGICKKASWGSCFYKIQPRKKDKIIKKEGYSAFFGTKLHEILREKGINTVIITGISTHICVDSTVRDAYQYGYEVVVLEDLVATRDGEREYHENALYLIKEHFGKVLSSEEFLNNLE